MKITPFYRRGYNVIEQTAQIIGFNFQTGSPVFGDVQYSNQGIQKATGIEALYNKEVPLGVSMQIGATYISQFGNEPPGTFLQPAALALGYGLSLARPLAVSDQRRFNYKKRQRLAHQSGHLRFNAGYPYGAGYYTAVYCNGIPVVVPSTSLSLIYSQTPGLHRSARSRHVHQAEYRRDARHSRTGPGRRIADDAARRCRPHGRVPAAHASSSRQSVFGLQIVNLFNQLYNVPVYNGCYGAPVTTGLASGNAPCTYSTAPYAPPDVSAHLDSRI